MRLGERPPIRISTLVVQFVDCQETTRNHQMPVFVVRAFHTQVRHCQGVLHRAVAGQGPLATYEALVKDGTLRQDAAQHAALQQLERVYNDLLQMVQHTFFSIVCCSFCSHTLCHVLPFCVPRNQNNKEHHSLDGFSHGFSHRENQSKAIWTSAVQRACTCTGALDAERHF